jgi:transcription elongation factor Elf1
LSFGSLILLQPELLDAYASRMIIAARNNGMGSISEADARSGHFDIREEERIEDRQQEPLLLLAVIEDLLRYEIAFRVYSDDGSQIVFPTQLTREVPIKGQALSYTFDGPVTNIYATLAVRLAQSGVFVKQDMWKNAIEYTTGDGGKYGIRMQEIEEGRGELVLFFDEAASEAKKRYFEDFIHAHLVRRALPNTIVRAHRFACPRCDTELTDAQIVKLKEKGVDSAVCMICETRFSILDQFQRDENLGDAVISQMVNNANANRDKDVADFTIQGKFQTESYDVFLCHNGKDKALVKEIGNRLKQRGILPWLDEWNLRPGLPWQQVLEEQINSIKSAAVFVGKTGFGPWQDLEQSAFLRQFVNRHCPVIPVILPDCIETPQLPVFLDAMTWVDFRKTDPDPLRRLIWGITGKSPT